MQKQLRKSERLGKLISSVMAIGMFAFSLNIPTPVVVQKDAEVAFPCQHCPCGCENAQQCWDSCCCYSDSEKMTWARANRVTPPAWFLERIANQATVASLESGPTVTQPKVAPKKQSCCCCHCESKPVVKQVPSKSSSKTIAVRATIKQLLGCQGRQELLKKQIVYILDAAPEPVGQPYWHSLPIISESRSNLAIEPPIRPS